MAQERDEEGPRLFTLAEGALQQIQKMQATIVKLQQEKSAAIAAHAILTVKNINLAKTNIRLQRALHRLDPDFQITDVDPELEALKKENADLKATVAELRSEKKDRLQRYMVNKTLARAVAQVNEREKKKTRTGEAPATATAPVAPNPPSL